MKTVREMLEEILINPVLCNRPKSYPHADFLIEMFCVNSRPIGRYHCYVNIEIKGNKVEGNKFKAEQVYLITHPAHIIVRMDDTRPEHVEVECEKHGVIRIDVDQWDRVRSRIKKGEGQDEV